MNWIPLAVGLVLIVSGVVILVNRARASASITEVQGVVFPFLRAMLAKKKKPTGLVVASAGWMVLGLLMVVLSLTSIVSRG
jgi:uncharacterized membrane protein